MAGMEAEVDSTEGEDFTEAGFTEADFAAGDFTAGVGASAFMGRTVIPTIPSAMTITTLAAATWYGNGFTPDMAGARVE